jgi:hypothetical protein
LSGEGLAGCQSNADTAYDAAWMQDRFDYQTLWEILDRLRTTHRIVRFADMTTAMADAPFVILRHDVDYLTDAALALAREEASRGVRASYFLLLNGFYYNLLDPRHAHVPAALIDLGHEVGLHYDVNFLRRFPESEWPRLLRMQADILETLSGQAVVSISMHQPGLYGDDPLRHRPELGFLNAYDDRFFREMTYVSDSCRAWRDATWALLTEGPLPRQLQLVLHPLNWGPVDRDREAIFEEVHTALAREIEDAGRDLLDKIARHTGVVEHTARATRVRSDRS